MHFNKKGQKEGGQIATILILIAFFMTLYILFIPPADREKILEGTSNDLNLNTEKISETIELLAQSPGIVSPSKSLADSHSIPSINLFVRTEPNIEQLAQNLLVKKSLFSVSSPKLKFSSEGTKNTKRVTLNFYSDSEDSGELRIKLNGRTIYSEEIGKGQQIIDINKNLLNEENELEFSASHPGLAFWAVNKFQLKNVILKQEFERTNTHEERSFTITKAEKQTLSKAILKYTQVCNQLLKQGTTLLDISINGKRASSSKILCITTDQQIELDPTLLNEGQNEIEFRLEEGDFSFNQILLSTTTSESKFLTYRFSIPIKEFEKLSTGKSVKLELLFAQDNKEKNARLDINNNEVLVNTEDNSFTRDITDLVVDGTNFIRIIPGNTFTIINLRVLLED